MIDYKATIKNIHSALSDLNIDELLIILDCIKEIPTYNNSVHINSGGYTYPSVDNVLLTSKLKSPSVSDTPPCTFPDAHHPPSADPASSNKT